MLRTLGFLYLNVTRGSGILITKVPELHSPAIIQNYPISIPYFKAAHRPNIKLGLIALKMGWLYYWNR
jgi:hypothetical protein